MTATTDPQIYRAALRRLFAEIRLHDEIVGTASEITGDPGRRMSAKDRRHVMGALVQSLDEIRDSLVTFLETVAPETPLIESLGEIEIADLPQTLPGILASLFLKPAPGQGVNFIELCARDPHAFAAAVEASTTTVKRRAELGRKANRIKTL
jgi:hypothetical protein